jgi:hypothetical protein
MTHHSYAVYVEGYYVGTLRLTVDKARELEAQGYVLRRIRRAA